MIAREQLSDRCPLCGRFQPANADGYYDSLTGDGYGEVFVFCNEEHADRYHARRQGVAS